MSNSQSYYGPLFDHMMDEHGLTLLDSELNEIVQIVAQMVPTANGRRKPDPTRLGVTRKLTVAEIDIYVTVNTFADGAPCEMFIKANGGGKRDGDVQGWLHTLAVTASMALQRGATLEEIMRHWREQRFEPSQLGRGLSIPDAIARALMPAEKEQHATE